MDMNCRACGATHQTGARFCGECGAAFTSDAPSNPATETAIGDDNGWVALAGGTAASPSGVSPEPVPVAAPSLVKMPAALAQPDEIEPHIARGEGGRLSIDPVVADEPAVAPPPPPRDRRTGRALWIGAIILGLFAAILIVAWTVSWTRGDSFATVAASTDDPASSDEEWPGAYADQFIGDAPVTMITNASANVRDYPTTAGSQVLRAVPEASEISGRWVRGRDPATRWLKLADGGYIWDGNLAERGGANSPIRIPFSNNDISFGPDIEVYMERARADSAARSEGAVATSDKDSEQAYADLADQSFYIRVPNRRWRGLTVTAVAQHFEAGSIYFREDEATARAAFRAAGIRFNNDGLIAAPNDEPVACSIGAVTADDRPYGGSALTCGV